MEPFFENSRGVMLAAATALGRVVLLWWRWRTRRKAIERKTIVDGRAADGDTRRGAPVVLIIIQQGPHVPPASPEFQHPESNSQDKEST